MRDPPSLGGVGEFAETIEGVFVVDEPDVGLPGQLHEGVLVEGNTFAEIAAVEACDLGDGARA